jgi:hypothetical protein
MNDITLSCSSDATSQLSENRAYSRSRPSYALRGDVGPDRRVVGRRLLFLGERWKHWPRVLDLRPVPHAAAVEPGLRDRAEQLGREQQVVELVLAGLERAGAPVLDVGRVV